MLQNIEVDNFDDFGVDLYPVPEVTLSSADLDTDKNTCTGNDEKSDHVARYTFFSLEFYLCMIVVDASNFCLIVGFFPPFFS